MALEQTGFQCDAFQQSAFQNDCAIVVVVTKGYPPKHRKKKRAERPVEYRSSKREKEWQALLDEQFGKKADIRKELLEAIDGKPEPEVKAPEVKAPELANPVVAEAAPVILTAPIFDPVRIIPEAPAIDPDEEALMILLLAA